MAPVVTAIPPPVIPNMSKIKRPPPPGIQTNGAVNSSTSSPSPSMTSKKPPTSAGVNGAVQQPPRPANRARQPSAQLSARNAKASAGLRSASLVLDTVVPEVVDPPPYIVTDKYILKKFAGNPPSLVIHLHPSHFRFDQQDGTFSYKSPMRLFLEHLRKRTIPHELLEDFIQAGVPFYQGRLIVQVHDHKSATQSKDIKRPTSSEASTTIPSSIHNHTPYIVPSPYVPYPKDNVSAVAVAAQSEAEGEVATKAEEKDKEVMPAPALPGEGQKSKAPPKPKIFTVVLHPTPHSLQTDLEIKARTPRGSAEGRASVDGNMPPQTPLSLVPPTPTVAAMPPPAKRLKRERMELDATNIREAEAQILLATMPILNLAPTKDAHETIRLLDALAHPAHSDAPPEPKTRKRTIAEMAADQAHQAELERYMLTLDERLATSGGAPGGTNGADDENQAAITAFEPNFARFKVIADIKREHAEKKEQEKLRQAENERKIQAQRLQQQQEQAAAAAAAQQRQEEENKARREQAAAEKRAQRQAMAAQANAQRASQNAAAAANQAVHAQQAMSNGAPVPNAAVVQPNGIPAQAQARFAQVSQAPVSSPVIRQGTPHSMSSPMPGAVPMQQSNSNMAASPPRPPSVAQGHPNLGGVPMTNTMSARASQQSHGTPRMPHGTPNMQGGTPVPPRAMVATPRMTQASPPPGMMASNSQMGQHMMMNTPNMQQQMQQDPNLIAAQIAQRQRAIQQSQMPHGMQNGMMNGQFGNGQQLTPQQINMEMQRRAMMQQQQRQQQQQQQQQQHQQQQLQGNPMTPQQQMAQRYAQLQNLQNSQMGGQMSPQMQAQLQAQLQQQMGNNMQRPMMNPNMAQNMNMQQAMLLQQQQQQQQAQQQNNFATQIRMHSQMLFNKGIPDLAKQWGGAAENIPPDQMDAFKKHCMMQAKSNVNSMIQQRRAAQQQAAMMQHQQQQQQQASMQGMGGMMGQGPHGM